MTGIVLARVLGWFSVALGLLEVLAPRALARNLGVPGGAALVRGYGLRELIAGATIFGKPDSPLGPWSRVAGDGLNLATLLMALRPRNRKRGAAGVALVLVAGVTALDVGCAVALTERNRRSMATARRSRFTPPSGSAGIPAAGTTAAKAS